MRKVEQARGVLAAIQAGHPTARALAVADSRAFVRGCFLSSAVRLDVLALLRTPRSVPELAQRTGCTRPERLRAWLNVGAALGELDRRGDRYVVRGRRARAIADGDALLAAHYRSLLDYQVGPYEELARLLRSGPGDGRDDIEQHAAVIADVSLAAAPFIVPFLRRAVTELRPARALDVGCGTGTYTQVLLEADPELEVDAIDLSEDVVAHATALLAARGLGRRARVHTGDVRHWNPDPKRRFGLITLLNDIYYFASDARASLYERLAGLLDEGGELLIVTMTTPGSIASAHLDFMLRCQNGAAALPEASSVEQDLTSAGLVVVERVPLVPTEPFVAWRATRR